MNKRRKRVSLVQDEPAARGAPGGEEVALLGVGEVVVGEVETVEGGAAGGDEHGLDVAGRGGLEAPGVEAVDGRVQAGGADAADDVAGEVEEGEGRALGAVLEEGGRAGEADVVVLEEELLQRAVEREGAGERLGAGVEDLVAAEVEADEGAALEVVRVAADAAVVHEVVGEGEAGEARAPAEAGGEAVAVRVVARAVCHVQGREGGARVQERGEALDAVAREVVLGEVDVLEGAEGAEQRGERVEVRAAVCVKN